MTAPTIEIVTIGDAVVKVTVDGQTYARAGRMIDGTWTMTMAPLADTIRTTESGAVATMAAIAVGLDLGGVPAAAARELRARSWRS